MLDTGCWMLDAGNSASAERDEGCWLAAISDSQLTTHDSLSSS